MCSGPEGSKSTSTVENKTKKEDMGQLTVETEDSFSSLLELASNNDTEGFKKMIERFDDVGLWYCRKEGSKQIVLGQRTPLMVAATYGSLDVLKLIVSQPEVNVNFSCGPDKITALHCAASGGSINSVEVVRLLLLAGADPHAMDANGYRPVDVIIVPPKSPSMKACLQELLTNNVFEGGVRDSRVSITSSDSISPPLSSSPENSSPCSLSECVSSPMTSKLNGLSVNSVSEKKEYQFDPSLPDIKNSIYSTDEFRIFSFKIRPCSRAYSHDWTECPFVHPGENARRRDPRKYHYSCVPCPDFRTGACRRGDMCEYAHGVFESWLHPALYRTRLCKDGTSCARRVCFFAHTPQELRPLYVSTGSAVPSPRPTGSTASALDMAAVLSLLPGSPTGFNRPMSPSANGISHSSVPWPQPNVPTLHLPGSNFQSSRLRSSLNARDMPPEDLQLLSFSHSHPNMPSLNRCGYYNTPTPSNLEELFSAEINSSPRFSDQAAAGFSPSHKSAVLSQLSPINTRVFSPKNVDNPFLQASFGISSPPGRMSPRGVEPISPMNSCLSPFAHREMHHQQLRSPSCWDLGSNNTSSIVGSPVNSWSKWGSPNGKADWSVSGDELGQLRKSSSCNLSNNDEEPDLSWVQSVVKESPPEVKDKYAIPVSGMSSGEGLKSNSQLESIDHSVLGAWLEQLQLDQVVA